MLSHHTKSITIADINLERALARFCDDKRFFSEICRCFIDTYQNIAIELTNHVATKQWPALQVTLHTLKGSAANIGAEQLSHCASEFEQQLKNQCYDSSTQLLINLLDSWQQTLPILHKIVAEFSPPPPTETWEESVFFEQLNQLQDLLTHDMAAADKFFAKLKGKQAPQSCAKDFNVLSQQIDRLEINAANMTLIRLVENKV